MTASGSAVSHDHQSAFKEQSFRRYFPASCCSTLGSWMVRFLLGWSAWDLTHSATWVGVVAGSMLMPIFLLSPIFGIVSDRINPRNGMLVTVSLHGIVAAAAGLAYLLEWFSLAWLIALSIALGAATAAHTPMRLALVPQLVPRRALPSAIGYSAMIFNASRIVGPAIGAWSLTHTSMASTYFAAVALFLVALPCLLSVENVRQVKRLETGSMALQLRAGLQYASGHMGIRLVFGLTLVNGLMGRTVIELLPAISGQLLQGDARTLAILTASAGIGSICGGLIVSRQGGKEARLLNLAIASLLFGAISLFSSHWLQGLTTIGALIVLLSLIITVVGTSTQALAQLLVEESYRGRVLSLWAVLAMGAPAVGTLCIGALADALGFRLVLPIAAVLAVAGIAGLYRRRSWLLHPVSDGDAPPTSSTSDDVP